MVNDISEILFDEEVIHNRTSELAAQISADYLGKDVAIIGVLKGSFVFVADLIRAITIPIELDFMAISSYASSTVSSGVVKIKKDIDLDLSGKHVIIVEDIVDSGLSLNYIMDFISKHNTKSVKSCVLLDKPDSHKKNVKVDYVGFEIGDEFVVGYGLDYAEKYRNLPFIGILKQEIYK